MVRMMEEKSSNETAEPASGALPLYQTDMAIKSSSASSFPSITTTFSYSSSANDTKATTNRMIARGPLVCSYTATDAGGCNFSLVLVLDAPTVSPTLSLSPSRPSPFFTFSPSLLSFPLSLPL